MNALSRWTKAGRRMTRKEMDDVKRMYHIGDDRYAAHLVVEHLVSEVEALWRERARLRKWRRDEAKM